MNRFLLSFVCVFSLISAQAQIHEVGVFLGGSNYIGDIGPTTYIAPNSGAFGILYKWNRSPRHAFRFSYTQSKLSSRDSKSDMPARKQRNYDFENNIKEVSLGLEFNFFEFNLHESGFIATPYIHSGLSYVMYDELYIINGKTEKDGSKSSLAIPITLGVKTKLNKNFVLGFEVGARYTFTDNLDGSNPSSEAYQHLKFGNINNEDWYVFTGFTLTYTFGNKPCYCRE